MNETRIKYGTNSRTPTIRDVAARAGVATASVSNVLTGRRRVTENRRQLVLEAVAALGYQPNHFASSLRLRQSMTVGIVVPDLTNPFFAALVHRIEQRAALDGYQILLVDSSNDSAREAARMSALLARQIDGLILAPTADTLPSLEHGGSHERHRHIVLPPTVLIDRAFGLAGFDTVAADNADACYRGCQHLRQLGHRAIAFLVTRPELANTRDRIDGFCRALRDSGIIEPARIVNGGINDDECRHAIEAELRGHDRPTAIFAASYDATLGAIKAIRNLDLAFPEDVALLGFDDFDWMTLLRPYVSTIAQPIDAMATTAWELLRRRLVPATPETTGAAAPLLAAAAAVTTVAAHARIRLPCTLQVRESTRPPADVAQQRRFG